MIFTRIDTGILFTFPGTTVTLADTWVCIGDRCINFPGEYEYDEILIQVMEQGDVCIFSLQIENTRIAYIPNSEITLDESIIKFLGDIDICVIPGKKEIIKIIEKIDPKVLIPFGSENQSFFAHMGQSPEAVKNYKFKISDMSVDSTTFVNLEL